MSKDLWVALFMVIGLKLPVGYLVCVTWWAIRSTGEPVAGQGEDGCPAGGWRRGRPRLPRWPRRGGPHGAPLSAPPRVRQPAGEAPRETAGRH